MNPNAHESLNNPVMSSVNLIHLVTSPLSEHVHKYCHKQTLHCQETTFQTMVQAGTGDLWRAVRIVNEDSANIASSRYLFASNNSWENGVRTLMFDTVFNNLIDETTTVDKSGNFQITDIFRSGDSAYISGLIEMLGLNEPTVLDKRVNDEMYFSPEQQQMYRVGHPEFEFVGKANNRLNRLARFLIGK